MFFLYFILYNFARIYNYYLFLIRYVLPLSYCMHMWIIEWGKPLNIKTLISIASDAQNLLWLLSALTGIAIIIIGGLLFLLVFFKRINQKAQNQINYFKDNGKYIDGLFVELSNTVEFLRYFIYEKKWKNKIINIFNNIYDNYYGQIIRKSAKGKKFSVSLSKINSLKFILETIETQKEIYSDYERTTDFFDEDNDEQLILITSARYSYKNQLEELHEYCSAITSRFVILKGTAGNGKTNFLCNMVQTVINNKLPCIFLNSRDIKINLNEYFDDYLSVPEFLKKYKKNILWIINMQLKLQRQNLYIVIDAINENDSKDFQDSIADFINNIEKYSNFKILVSCRSEYFENRYEKLFRNKIKMNPYIFDIKEKNNYSPRAIEKTYNKYREYFNFRGTVSANVLDGLFNSLLLMRLFFEVYKNTNDKITSLNKFNIYQKYIEEIKTNNPTIENLLTTIVKLMIKNKEFDEIRLQELGFSEQQQKTIRKIADENLLMSRTIKRDENTIIERTEEVFYFVFDEMRDYCLCRELILNCVQNEKENFASLFEFINELYYNKLSPIEGILKYSYYYFRDNTILENNAAYILKNYTSSELSRFIIDYHWKQDRFKPKRIKEHNSNLNFYDFGLNLIFSCDKPLLSFEKIYISESLINNNFADVTKLFMFLYKNGDDREKENTCYSFSLFFDFLMNISKFETLQEALNSFTNHRDEELPQEELVKIFKDFKNRKDFDAYYKFILVLVAIFPKAYNLRKVVLRHGNINKSFFEIKSETSCVELKQKIDIVKKDINDYVQGGL